MNRNTRKHLRVSKITVRNLSSDDLSRVGGRDQFLPNEQTDNTTSHGCDTTTFSFGICPGGQQQHH